LSLMPGCAVRCDNGCRDGLGCDGGRTEWLSVRVGGDRRIIGGVAVIMGSLEPVPRGLPAMVIDRPDGTALSWLVSRFGRLPARISPVRHQ